MQVSHSPVLGVLCTGGHEHRSVEERGVGPGGLDWRSGFESCKAQLSSSEEHECPGSVCSVTGTSHPRADLLVARGSAHPGAYVTNSLKVVLSTATCDDLGVKQEHVAHAPGATWKKHQG